MLIVKTEILLLHINLNSIYLLPWKNLMVLPICGGCLVKNIGEHESPTVRYDACV
jgi:hypothetical protein